MAKISDMNYDMGYLRADVDSLKANAYSLNSMDTKLSSIINDVSSYIISSLNVSVKFEPLIIDHLF